MDDGRSFRIGGEGRPSPVEGIEQGWINLLTLEDVDVGLIPDL